MRRFYAPAANFKNNEITLDVEETRHLRDVLRLREAAEVYVFDGDGGEFRCRVKQIGKRETVLQILEKVSPKSSESPLYLTLAVALLKGERFDLVIQKACELGVSTLIPLQTKRADVKLKDTKEIEKRLDRWRRIALESAKQSGRAKLMRIDSPVSFEIFAAQSDLSETENELKFFFSERNGSNLADYVPQNKNIEKITAIVGSEGGWDDAEIELADKNNFRVVTLGGRILRAETAAITVSALLQNHFGDLR